MQSIKKAQDSLGKDFDFGGSAKQAPIELKGVELVMFKAAERFRVLALRRIRQRKKVDTGKLSEIEITAVRQVGTKYELTIGYDESNPASEYYDFQNKGVRGLTSKKPSTSPYYFKEYWVSKNMVKALMEWYKRHRNYIKNEDQTKNLKGLQKKRKSITAMVDSSKNLKRLATNTAKAIKKRGMPRIGFFEDNLDKAFGEQFKKDLAVAMGQDVILNIKQNFDNGNNVK